VQAVEDFYMQLVSGRQSLSAVGLDPPAAQTSMQQDSMPQQQQHRDLQHQQDQQQQANGSAGQDAPSSGSKPTRVTYKVTPMPSGGEGDSSGEAEGTFDTWGGVHGASEM
jgi:hypothetical protein